MADSKPVKTEPSNSSSSSTVTLKLVIDKKEQLVLFAEANKDFVDFLFSLTVLPTGTTIRLLSMQGGLSNLCRSINNLNSNYIQPNQTKNVLLKPVSLFPFCSLDHQVSLLPTEPFLSPPTAPNPTGPYKCFYCNIISSGSGGMYPPVPNRYYGWDIMSSGSEATCPKCYGAMTETDETYVLKSYKDAEGGGFVKGLVKYMVMDDLSVSPLSDVSHIGLLSKFNIKELGDLEERVVHVGMDEGLDLLKHSLNSKTVLTDVFLGEVIVKDGNMKKRKS